MKVFPQQSFSPTAGTAWPALRPAVLPALGEKDRMQQFVIRRSPNHDPEKIL
jgi:hypothetical protein